MGKQKSTKADSNKTDFFQGLHPAVEHFILRLLVKPRPSMTIPTTSRPPALTRRSLLASVAVTASSVVTASGVIPAPTDGKPRRLGIPLGFDNFAVRALGWNARQLIDHSESLRCDSLFITDFGPFEGRLDDA